MRFYQAFLTFFVDFFRLVWYSMTILSVVRYSGVFLFESYLGIYDEKTVYNSCFFSRFRRIFLRTASARRNHRQHTYQQ